MFLALITTGGIDAQADHHVGCNGGDRSRGRSALAGSGREFQRSGHHFGDQELHAGQARRLPRLGTLVSSGTHAGVQPLALLVRVVLARLHRATGASA